jgi:arginyl-tRNA---protein transferase
MHFSSLFFLVCITRRPPFCFTVLTLPSDPDYRALSLGTISSLFEISLAKLIFSYLSSEFIDSLRFLNSLDPALQFYYMGYFIESCPKMRYKGRYKPSYLFNLEKNEWELLDENLFIELKRNKTLLASKTMLDFDIDVDNIPIAGTFEQVLVYKVIFRIIYIRNLI